MLRTADRLRQVAGLLTAPSVVVDQSATTLSLELGPDEDILGFGEQFGRLVKNGQKLRLRSEDACGTGTGMAYKPVPVWHSSRGYTGFVNTGAVVTADVGHSRPSVLSLGVDDAVIDLYVVAGADPAARLTAYTALTGTAGRPAAVGVRLLDGALPLPHQRGDARGRPDDAAARRAARRAAPRPRLARRRPAQHRLHLEHLPVRRPQAVRRRPRATSGIRLSVWELPYLDPASPIFEHAEREGYLVKRTDGSLASIVKTPTPDGRMRALIDFTNPDARRWWQEMHREFLDDGVAVFKTDFGEALPDDVALFDGTPPHQAHNLYPLRYNGAVSDAIREFTDRAPLVWGRSGWAGSQRYPGQWGGDAESTVAGMQATVRGGLSYAMSAPGFWSHDIGGFFGPELTPALYVRWTQLGALSPLMRAHGLRPREPWAFGDEALRICRDWVRLRYSLLPYLWQVANESAANGWPVMRPLGFHYPDDRVARSVDDSFLLGRDLLVVPVFDDADRPVSRTFYVPEGRWYDLEDGTTLHGSGLPHRRRPARPDAAARPRGCRHPARRRRRDGPLGRGPPRPALAPTRLRRRRRDRTDVGRLRRLAAGRRRRGRAPWRLTPDRWADLPEKLAALASVARDRGLDTLVLRDPANLTWLLGGRVNVPQTLDTACLDVVVDCATPPRITVVTNAIEAPRLRDTELAGLDADVGRRRRGGRAATRGFPAAPHVGSDRPLPDAAPVAADLALLRRRLTDRQRRLLREVCGDAAAAATAAALALTPATTEYQAAGLLARELLDRELDPIVLLVGGARRLDAHRHPLPTGEPLGGRGMLVACARRHGLVASVTRIVSFEPLGSTSATPTSGCCTSSRPSSTPPAWAPGWATSSPPAPPPTVRTGSTPTSGTATTRAASAASSPASFPRHEPATRS